MSNFNFVSPGAAAGDAIRAVMIERQKKQRQDLLDSIAVAREGREAKAEGFNEQYRQRQLANMDETTAYTKAQREAQTVETERKTREGNAKDTPIGPIDAKTAAGLPQNQIEDPTLPSTMRGGAVPVAAVAPMTAADATDDNSAPTPAPAAMAKPAIGPPTPTPAPAPTPGFLSQMNAAGPIMNKGNIDQQHMKTLMDDPTIDPEIKRMLNAIPEEHRAGPIGEFIKGKLAANDQKYNTETKNIVVKGAHGETLYDGMAVYDPRAKNSAGSLGRYTKSGTNDEVLSPEGGHIEERKPPHDAPTVVMQTVDENGNSVNKIVPKVAGTSYAAQPKGTLANRLESARAVVQTGNDITKKLTDPKFMATVGPVMGRYSSLADFVGNPPPEYAELAGQINSLAMANQGVHGMRNAESARELAKEEMGMYHTPEAIAHYIIGLNSFAAHLLENNKMSATPPGDGAKTTTGTSSETPEQRDARLLAIIRKAKKP